MHAFKFRKLVDSREQLRLVMIAATLAFAVLLAVAPDTGAQSPDAISNGLMVNSGCSTAIMPGTEVDASSSIVMYVGPRCDTENIMDEPFEFVVAADDSAAMEMYAQRSDTENIMDEEREDILHDYFMSAASDSIKEALNELSDEDFGEEEIRVYRIKFISEHAN